MRLGTLAVLWGLWLANLLATAAAAPTVSMGAMLNTDALQPGQQAVLAVVLDIPAGHHVQSHTPSDPNYIRLQAALDPHPYATALPPQYPPGEEHQYPILGKLNVNTGRAVVFVPLRIAADAPAGPTRLTGTVTYQMCDDKTCFPPESPRFAVDVPVVPLTQPVTPQHADVFATFDPRAFSELPAEQATDLGLGGLKLRDDAYLLAFLAAILVGIIFNLMPCVLPVVPLKAIGFYEISRHNRARCIALGSVFSLGIVAVFAGLSIPVVVLRTFSWGEQFSNPWFLGAMILLLVTMALGMFGAFNVILPQGVYRITPRHDTYTGNFLFGILAAVLSTPCTAPMFLGLLIWATRQPPALGVALVMTVGVGMALPYLVLSIFPELARRLPRTGPWSEMIKQLMGFLLLGVAFYFARPFLDAVLSRNAFWWGLFAIVAAAALFLVVRAFQFSPRLLPRLAALAVALVLAGPALGLTLALTHHPIDWQEYSPEAVEAARQTGRPVLLEFTADWCANCQVLEATVLHSKSVVAAIRRHNVVPFRVDVTRRDAPGWKRLTELNPVGAIPLTAVYLPGREKPEQLSGVYTPGVLVELLDRAKAIPADH